MKRASFVGRTLVGIVAVLSLVGVAQATPADAASRYARITLHVNECPADTRDVFGDCHENRVEGFTFYIAGKAKVTDANGVASGAPGAGRNSIRPNAQDLAPYYIAADGAPPSYIYCTDQVTGAVLKDVYEYGGPTITTTAGQPVVCDWYLLIY